jgi:uncharacterized membrane protein
MEYADRIDEIGGAGTQAVGVASAGQAFFAVTMVGLGIVGFAEHDFIPTWAGVPKSFPAREALVYLSAFVSIATGVGLLWRRTARISSLVLLTAFAVWMLLFRIPVIFRAPTATGAWWATGDTAAMAAAAWVLFVWFADDRDRERFSFATGDNGLRLATALYGLGLIPFGVAHFTYLERTVSMVPGWLPWHLAWACFFGGTFIAAGVAALTGVYGRLAVTLSAVQVALFTVLVWVPVIIAGPTASDWGEILGSWSLTAATWMVADSYRGVPWLAVRN